MKKHLYFLLVGLLLSGCSWLDSGSAGEKGASSKGSDSVAKIEDNIEIEQKGGLIIYYPNYKSIDLACEKMPNPCVDSSVIFCCSASFTGELLDEFKHSNIAGNHVSGGEFYKGYKCGKYSGGFAYYGKSGKWEFVMGSAYQKAAKKAAELEGMAFEQVMVIYNGKRQPKQTFKNPRTANQYRVLAELDGELCVIDSEDVIGYGSFIDRLLKIGVANALYLDMGSGWNHSYYRDNNDTVRYIHRLAIPYTTNWLTFKR